MRVVIKEEATNFPRVCVFTGSDDGPFLDTETWLNARDLNGVDPYGYISVQKVIDMGRAVGMVPKDEVDALREQVANLDRKYQVLAQYAEAIEGLKAVEEQIEVAA